MKAAKLLKTNVLVIRYTGQMRQFGADYSDIEAVYLNENSQKVIIILNKHPTSIKSKQNTTLFQALKYNHLQQKVSHNL